MARWIRLVLMSLFLLAGQGLDANTAQAVPLVLQLQGALRTAAGSPVPDGLYPLTVRLYAGQQDVNALGSQAIPEVTVQGGLFAVSVGDGQALDPAWFSNGTAQWIGLQVGLEPELSRSPLRPVPYAVAAQSADVAKSAVSAQTASSLACTGCVGLAQLDPAVLQPYAKSTQLADVAKTGSYADLLDKPDLAPYVKAASLAKVAGSGAYIDLSGTPDLSVYAKTADLAAVAKTGNLADLQGKLPDSALPAGLVLAGADNVLTGKNTAASLSVTGSLRIPADAGPCNAAKAGTLRFYGNRFEGCNGTTWVRLDSAQQQIAWWSFDEGSGTDIACSVNAANNGKVVGAQWLTGAECKVGNCLKFSGTVSTYATLPVTPLQGLTDFTVSLWARQTSPNTTPFIFSVAVPGVDNYMLLYAPTDATWVHIVWRRAGGVVHAYKDGKLADALMYTNPGNPIDVKGGALILGQDQDVVGGNFEATQAFGGVIDELKIFDYAVTDADIAAGFP